MCEYCLGMWDEHDVEIGLPDAVDGERYAVDGYRTFFDDIANVVSRNCESELFPRRKFDHLVEVRRRIDMPHDEMAAQSVADAQSAFEMDAIAGAQAPEIGASERFARGVNFEDIGGGCIDGEAYPVDGDAFAERIGGHGGVDAEAYAVARWRDLRYRTDMCDESCEHCNDWR